MTFHIVPMNLEYAMLIVTWRYPAEYALYDYENEADYILDPANWGCGLFAVLDEHGVLCGELSFGYLDADFGWVEQEAVERGELGDCILWVGFGMRPDLTGRGLGGGFVRTCVEYAADFARQVHGYQGEYIGLGVYEFNQRAIKVYERLGFEEFMRVEPVKNGQGYPARRMRMKIAYYSQRTSG